MVLETFRQALQNVWSNKLRTFLTMLGIIIGVMAVIVIVGLGNGMTRSMRDSFSALGTNTLSIQIWGYGSRTATVDDLYDIVKKNPKLLSSVSPQLDFSDNTPKVGTTTYRYSGMYGVDESYIEMKGYTLAKGRNIQYMDIADNKQICVIGDYINRTAYGGNAVGQTIKLGPYKFRIVGVLKAKISNPDQQEAATTTASTCPTPQPCAFPTKARRTPTPPSWWMRARPTRPRLRWSRDCMTSSRATVLTTSTAPASGWKR